VNSTDFASLALPPALLTSIGQLGYTDMTPIQAAALPAILHGKDMIAKAKTGSGKTATFGLGVLARLDVGLLQAQTLVLCPTRELAEQVGKEIRRLASTIPNVKLVILCGGTPILPQTASLEFGAHIVVGTPGRVLKHLEKGTLKVDALNILVLDEADRMLDMGFEAEIKAVVKHLPKARQTLLFSATYPEGIASLSKGLQKTPVQVSVESQHDDEQIEQLFFEVEHEQRLTALTRLLGHYQPESAVVFCTTKADCKDVAEHLANKGFSAFELHGDLEQRDRDIALIKFSNRSMSILVATDVAARGLDIKELGAVVNYELSHDPEVHVHRVGRTGRAGEKGLALSLFSPREVIRLRAIEDYQKSSATIGEIDHLKSVTGMVPPKPPMVTICIDGGRKDKVRAGDILGALTGEAGLAGAEVGKITIGDISSYVAIQRASAGKAMNRLKNGQIKGRKFRVRQV
jgi:ATP-independent RNA helicase DbpA